MPSFTTPTSATSRWNTSIRGTGDLSLTQSSFLIDTFVPDKPTWGAVSLYPFLESLTGAYPFGGVPAFRERAWQRSGSGNTARPFPECRRHLCPRTDRHPSLTINLT